MKINVLFVTLAIVGLQQVVAGPLNSPPSHGNAVRMWQRSIDSEGIPGLVKRYDEDNVSENEYGKSGSKTKNDGDSIGNEYGNGSGAGGESGSKGKTGGGTNGSEHGSTGDSDGSNPDKKKKKDKAVVGQDGGSIGNEYGSNGGSDGSNPDKKKKKDKAVVGQNGGSIGNEYGSNGGSDGSNPDKKKKKDKAVVGQNGGSIGNEYGSNGDSNGNGAPKDHNQSQGVNSGTTVSTEEATSKCQTNEYHCVYARSAAHALNVTGAECNDGNGIYVFEKSSKGSVTYRDQAIGFVFQEGKLSAQAIGSKKTTDEKPKMVKKVKKDNKKEGDSSEYTSGGDDKDKSKDGSKSPSPNEYSKGGDDKDKADNDGKETKDSWLLGCAYSADKQAIFSDGQFYDAGFVLKFASSPSITEKPGTSEHDPKNATDPKDTTDDKDPKDTTQDKEKNPSPKQKRHQVFDKSPKFNKLTSEFSVEGGFGQSITNSVSGRDLHCRRVKVSELKKGTVPTKKKDDLTTTTFDAGTGSKNFSDNPNSFLDDLVSASNNGVDGDKSKTSPKDDNLSDAGFGTDNLDTDNNKSDSQ